MAPPLRRSILRRPLSESDPASQSSRGLRVARAEVNGSGAAQWTILRLIVVPSQPEALQDENV
jgi:hypothetical protein